MCGIAVCNSYPAEIYDKDDPFIPMAKSD